MYDSKELLRVNLKLKLYHMGIKYGLKRVLRYKREDTQN